MLIAIFVAAEKAIAVSLAVGSGVENRKQTTAAAPIEVRTLRIVTFSAVRVVGARVQAIVITLVVRVCAVLIVAVIRGFIDAGVIPRAAALEFPPTPRIAITARTAARAVGTAGTASAARAI